MCIYVFPVWIIMWFYLESLLSPFQQLAPEFQEEGGFPSGWLYPQRPGQYLE